jgi:hypothetical protein
MDRPSLIESLPQWCANHDGRRLIYSILADRPQPRVRQHRLPSLYGGYSDGTSITYPGKVAGQLRRMHTVWLDRELKALDAQYAVSGKWDEDASTAILTTETADQLIARILGESERADLEPKDLPDGRYQVAA